MNYIDSVQNKGLVIPDSIKWKFYKGNAIPNDERFIYFNNGPKEWYLIAFDATPCWIEYIYNKQLADTLIIDRESLGEVQVERVEQRFIKEILDKAVQYGKNHNFADSVIYR